jgi:hypothetical protein
MDAIPHSVIQRPTKQKEETDKQINNKSPNKSKETYLPIYLPPFLRDKSKHQASPAEEASHLISVRFCHT